jgi:hypothetical protein
VSQFPNAVSSEEPRRESIASGSRTRVPRSGAAAPTRAPGRRPQRGMS